MVPPGFSDQSEVAMMNSEVSGMADRLDLSTSSIDMTNTSLSVQEEIDVSGVGEATLINLDEQNSMCESKSSW